MVQNYSVYIPVALFTLSLLFSGPFNFQKNLRSWRGLLNVRCRKSWWDWIDGSKTNETTQPEEENDSENHIPTNTGNNASASEDIEPTLDDSEK